LAFGGIDDPIFGKERILEKLLRGSGTSCRSVKGACERDLEISRERMLTLVIVNFVRNKIAENKRFFALELFAQSNTVPKRKTKVELNGLK